ncbi:MULTISPECIES: sensor histidine kinase [unclassified Clostridioides]|uniref:ATP-binding protein n=1 Tax=unclassified Clostridioides TaxID=2635829 RepID=UPI001D110F87|nr:GHKL domain-containing protein [Clostridioides sp. ES-S-0056-01]MCC0713884.1 GHKL domain-containing protein [Clostridioides sp. ES-S-0077-01]
MIKSSLFWNIFIMISFMIEWFFCKKMLDYTSEQKLSNRKINFYMVGIIIFANIIYFFDVSPSIRVIISGIITVVFYKTSYDVRFAKSILISLIYWMLLIATDALSISLTVWLNSIDDMSKMATGDIYRIESIVSGKILLILALFLYKTLKIKLNIEINKKTLSYIAIPIVANISSFFIIFRYMFNPEPGNVMHNCQFVAISIILLTSSIILILIAKKLQQYNTLVVENNMIKNILKCENEYYEDMESKYLKTRLLSHDMKNHILCISAMVKKGIDVTSYLNNLQVEIQSNDLLFSTGNFILDTILSEKKEICDKNKIELKVGINFGCCEAIELIDVCHIFSNILDNAIEACNKIDDGNRVICVKGDVIQNFYLIRVENTKVNQIITKNGDILTDKKGSVHGFGIKSIKNSVNKYGGNVVIEYDDKKFVVKIAIPLRNVKKAVNHVI